MHRREGKLIVSATDLVGFLACGHLTRLERAQAAGLIRKPHREDPEVELLQRRGGEHEGRYIAQLEADGRQVTRLRADWERPYEERAAETIAAMQRGDDVIYQATVFDGRWVGHPDFLLRVPGASALGDWHYEVADTKLAHSAKAGALVQICSYVDQLERIQVRRPDRVYVVTGGAEIGCHDFRTAELMAYYAYARARFEEALDEAISGAPVYPISREDSYPDPVEHCAVCRWFPEFCQRAWRDDDALPLVAGISRRQRGLLGENSVATMLALSQLPPPIQLAGLKRGQAESLWKMREQARLQVASAGLLVPVYELLPPEVDSEGALVADRGLSALPEPSAGDLFFDIEGDPFAYWEGLDYLFGIWSGDGEWRSLWAMNRDEERHAFEQVMDLFMERWAADPNMHIYHYAPYEPTALKRLAGRHGTREEELDRLLSGRVFVDLYRVVRQGLRVGSERYSIKNLEPLYGFTREVKLRDANSSIVEFEKILEVGDPEGELKAMIEAYNRDDCVSTQLLRDWLEERRPQAEREFGVQLPRPPIGEPEPPKEAATERQRAVRELEARLTAGLPSNAVERTPEQQATWLLAQLLDWHRRENKAAWWRFFDLLTRSDEELFDEREPISGLKYLGIDPEGGTARSHDHRYSFPAQEHSIDVGNEVHDPKLPGGATKTGGVQSMDKDNGVLAIRRSKAWAGQHPSAIVPLDVYGAQAQQEALMRIGNWVAVNGIDSPLPQYRAARDLLRRLAPRWLGGDGGKLVREAETGTYAARRLVTQLDGTTLPIQGPPGSGKTYTGARMILDLVRAGRRVGITSNSHKVICNLLEAVCDAAEEAAEPLRAMQKGEEDEVLTHDYLEVRRTDDNKVVAAALAAGEVDVAAGTPWLWARDEMEGLVDTLFIDEAGQVSLANVVAVAGAARNVVLLGDPQQLDQPTQGVHPDGAGRSALAHLLDTAETVPPESGVFLEKTWRMHPQITAYTSSLFYEGKLESVEGLEHQRVLGDDWLSGSGLRWVPVAHDGNTNASEAEAERVCEIWQALVGRRWVDAKGREQVIGSEGIVIVSPYNAHRLMLTEKLPGARIGTVDKFQGQEAPVSIYTMASSRAEDAPRGLGFLYSLNRLNVATSRARALAIVVASPALLDAVPRTPDQLRMVNGLCAFAAEAARPQSA
ncbi:MAG TPA: TM0106 family RecB-like putative nuclease [Candidatus Limnocylindria bacterium]|nr:TM0106 family RecB-like putative nuclease [Candidatus Limnocylindria bacterium]